MGTVKKTNYLVQEISSKIKESFGKWYVGTSEHDDVWLRNQWAEIVVFNVLDGDATLAAYDHFVGAGMRGRKPIGTQPNYLYLYRENGRIPDSFVY
jgi:hypothetical protein